MMATSNEQNAWDTPRYAGPVWNTVRCTDRAHGHDTNSNQPNRKKTKTQLWTETNGNETTHPGGAQTPPDATLHCNHLWTWACRHTDQQLDSSMLCRYSIAVPHIQGAGHGTIAMIAATGCFPHISQYINTPCTPSFRVSPSSLLFIPAQYRLPISLLLLLLLRRLYNSPFPLIHITAFQLTFPLTCCSIL